MADHDRRLTRVLVGRPEFLWLVKRELLRRLAVDFSGSPRHIDRMNSIDVFSQADLDAALAAPSKTLRLVICRGDSQFHLDRGNEVLVKDSVKIDVTGSALVTAEDHTFVRASGQAIVLARGDAKVIASEEARVIAQERASVEAKDLVRVEAYNLARVIARGNTTVVAASKSRLNILAYDDAFIRTFGRTKTEAHDRTHVIARSRSLVRACDDTHVEAFDQSTIWATDRSHVEAFESSRVLMSGQATVRSTGLAQIHPDPRQVTNGVSERVEFIKAPQVGILPTRPFVEIDVTIAASTRGPQKRRVRFYEGPTGVWRSEPVAVARLGRSGRQNYARSFILSASASGRPMSSEDALDTLVLSRQARISEWRDETGRTGFPATAQIDNHPNLQNL